MADLMCSFHVLQSGVISKKIYVNFVAKLWEKHISLNPQHRLHLLTYKAEDDYPNQACFAKKVMNKLEEDEHKRYMCIFIPIEFTEDLTYGMKQSFLQIKKTKRVIFASTSWLCSVIRHCATNKMKAKTFIESLACLRKHVRLQTEHKVVLFDPNDVPLPMKVEEQDVKMLKCEDECDDPDKLISRDINSYDSILNQPLAKIWLRVGEVDTVGTKNIKRIDSDVYCCDCKNFMWPRSGWAKNDYSVRTCKHLRELLGNAYENRRINQYGGPSIMIRDTGDGMKTISHRLALAYPRYKLKGEGGVKDSKGMWMTEKFDGMRGVFDGKRMWSRNGKPIHVPPSFLQLIPKDPEGNFLDGELITSRGDFEGTMKIIRTTDCPELWKDMHYFVFDMIPCGKCLRQLKSTFEERNEYLREIFRYTDKGGQIRLSTYTECLDSEHLENFHDHIKRERGEGVVLRNPKALHKAGRNLDFIKYKTWFDAEAVFVRWISNTFNIPNKRCLHDDTEGAVSTTPFSKRFVARMESGYEFVITLDSDKERKIEMAPGDVFTYKFFEILPCGGPRFPLFLYKSSPDKICARDIKDIPPTYKMPVERLPYSCLTNHTVYSNKRRKICDTQFNELK